MVSLEMGIPETDPLSQLNLPPGFRFYPTDEELLVQYLCRKVAGHHFALQIIAEIDLYKFDPWVLPSKAMFGEKEWYFFSPRDRKYPNGSRPNRVAGSGYWKATGTDKIITTNGRKVGIKKALVFYVGKAPKGTKTNWIMHEYRLFEPSRKNGSTKLDDWVLCRIYKKNSGGSQKPIMSSAASVSSKDHSNGSCSSSSSHLDDVLESLPEIDERFFSLPRMNSLKTLQHQHQPDDKISIRLQQMGSGNFDWASLAGLSSVPELVASGQTQSQGLAPGHAINNDYFQVIPTMPQMRHVGPERGMGTLAEEEVQSGLKTQQRLDNSSSAFFQQNPAASTQQSFYNSLDRQGFRYPTQPSGFGFSR